MFRVCLELVSLSTFVWVFAKLEVINLIAKICRLSARLCCQQIAFEVRKFRTCKPSKFLISQQLLLGCLEEHPCPGLVSKFEQQSAYNLSLLVSCARKTLNQSQPGCFGFVDCSKTFINVDLHARLQRLQERTVGVQDQVRTRHPERGHRLKLSSCS